MKYFILVKANIKRQKGSFFGIFLLIFIITVLLCAVLSIWRNANSYEQEQIDRIGYGDITSWVYSGASTEDLKEQIAAVDATDKVWEQEIIYVRYHVNGKEVENNGMVTAYDDGPNGYYIYNKNLTGIETQPEVPKNGEIYVSPAFCSLYDAKIGDSFEVEITGEQDMVSFTIKGFFEDPVAGSAMVGMKMMLINEEDMQYLTKRFREAGDQAAGGTGAMLHIYKEPDSALSVAEYRKILNDQTDLSGCALWTYTKSAIIGFMLIVQNIFSGFLLVFVAVLLAVTMIVISHSISSSMEQDYVNIGILKAVGFTKTDLRRVQLLQYFAVGVCGMICGIPVSALAVRLVNRMTVTATGFMIPEDMPFLFDFAALGAILLLLSGFICIKTGKLKRITPIRAIRGGAGDVYFKSRFTVPIYKEGVGFWLAVRELVSGKKQYISACLIAALLVFFLSLSSRIDAWLGPDGKGLMDSFGAVSYDLGIRCDNSRIQNEVEEVIRSYTEITESSEFKMEHAAINNMDSVMNVSTVPEYYNLLEGRTCKYENELILTEFIADDLGVWIGDSVSVTYSGRTMEYIVSGIYQCANDMGANFGVNMEGFERIGGNDSGMYTLYLLQDASAEKVIAERLKESYGDQIALDENTWSGLDSITIAMSALGILMYVVTIIFILVTVIMTGNKILYREQRNLGIYQSLGFSSAKLRCSFALRFGIISAAGSVLGVILSALLTDSIVTIFLEMCGISRFTSKLPLADMALPAMVVTGLFVIFAYLAAGKIKKVDPGILIAE